MLRCWVRAYRRVSGFYSRIRGALCPSVVYVGCFCVQRGRAIFDLPRSCFSAGIQPDSPHCPHLPVYALACWAHRVSWNHFDCTHAEPETPQGQATPRAKPEVALPHEDDLVQRGHFQSALPAARAIPVVLILLGESSSNTVGGLQEQEPRRASVPPSQCSPLVLWTLISLHSLPAERGRHLK